MLICQRLPPGFRADSEEEEEEEEGEVGYGGGGGGGPHRTCPISKVIS